MPVGVAAGDAVPVGVGDGSAIGLRVGVGDGSGGEGGSTTITMTVATAATPAAAAPCFRGARIADTVCSPAEAESGTTKDARKSPERDARYDGMRVAIPSNVRYPTLFLGKAMPVTVTLAPGDGGIRGSREGWLSCAYQQDRDEQGRDESENDARPEPVAQLVPSAARAALRLAWGVRAHRRSQERRQGLVAHGKASRREGGGFPRYCGTSRPNITDTSRIVRPMVPAPFGSVAPMKVRPPAWVVSAARHRHSYHRWAIACLSRDPRRDCAGRTARSPAARPGGA